MRIEHRIDGQCMDSGRRAGYSAERYIRKNTTTMRSRRAALAAVLALAALAAAAPALGVDVPTVAAAADLQFALPEIAAAFKDASGRDVRLTFGSSGNFRRQLAEGAPFELFLSADAAYVEALAHEGWSADDGAVYAIGRLALFVPQASSIEPDPQLRGVAAALADGRLRKFAIANPEHAPYGRAARQVLKRAGLWAKIEPRLVLGENVSQAAQFAAGGAAQAGIVAYSLVRSPALAGRGRHVLLPASGHDPLVQRMALAKRAGATARAFYEFLQRPVARAILERHGFQVP